MPLVVFVMCCSAIQDVDQLNSWCKLQGLEAALHALYTLHWSQSCLIDMFYQCVKMPGLWYEFNDTEHDNKACQRCIDKKLCLVFTPLCWHESALEITSSWWRLKWWLPTRIYNSHFDPCGMQFKLSKGYGGQLERQCCTCRLLPPPQSFDNMLRRNICNLHIGAWHHCGFCLDRWTNYRLGLHLCIGWGGGRERAKVFPNSWHLRL